MNQITNPPNEYDFGLDFNYGLWTADTEVTLVNVPWGNDYRDVVERGAADVNAYVDAATTSKVRFGEMSYIAPNTPVRLPLPINAVNKYNYIRVRNPKQPVDGDEQQDYFYFILDYTRKSPQATEVIVQLDAWATYRHRVTFSRAFVERGHIGIANVDANEQLGKRWLTTPEGFDTGTDYEIVNQDDIWRARLTNSYVLITAITDLIDDPGSIDDPKLNTSQGGILQAYSTATRTFAIHINNIGQYFTAMRQYPWVTQGIVKVTIVPNLPDVGHAVNPVPRHNNYPPGPTGSGNSYLNDVGSYSLGQQKPFSANAAKAQAKSTLPARYRGLDKFTVSPYTFIEVTNFNGSSVTYRPELFAVGDGECFVSISLIPGAERIEFRPGRYNARVDGSTDGESWDAGLTTGNLPNLPVVNDMAIGALAASAHGRAAARSAADWAQQIALESNANAYDGAALSASTSLGNDAIMRNLGDTVLGLDQAAQSRNMIYDSVGSTVMGAGAGGAVGGAAGAGVGALGGVANAAMSAAKLGRMQELERSKLGAANTAGSNVSTRNYNTSTTINESNKGLADRAARGNYEQTIGAMNARVQDTALTQPGMSGGFGGEFLRVMAEGFAFIRRIRMIESSSIERIGEHWLRYGYAIREFMKLPPSLMVMSKFTYWKVSEVYMGTSEIPELYKRTLAGILEKGVTVWGNPTDIGAIDIAENAKLPNIRIEK